ncbi:MAG: tRNA lysidine(34) synthetase TilS [Planctomycetia bacterium]|nr:tRNA lysidine(34) synthetase TilS [Planctomycetia bacterium]
MEPLEAHLAAVWPSERWQVVTVLVAASGGADSVALVRALASLRSAAGGQSHVGRLAVAHFNHGLRGPESDADERFVVALCRQLHLECCVGRAQAHPLPRVGFAKRVDKGELEDSNLGDFGDMDNRDRPSEESSRAARYEFLTATARRLGARYVVTAHTADDQAETILHHVLRGTGLAGLAGIPKARELADGIALVRPLLGARRAEVLAYLAHLRQPFCEDRTNRDPSYTRNRIRHELLPLLARDYSACVVDSLLRLGTLAAEAQAVIEEQASALADTCLKEADATRVTIDSRPLAAAPPYLAREALITIWRRQGWPIGAMGFAQWRQLAALATGANNEGSGDRQAAKRVFPGEVVAHREGDRLTLSRGHAP